MRHRLLLPSLLLLLAACGPKSGDRTATGGAAAGDPATRPAPPELEPLPADVVLWEGELPEDFRGFPVMEREGILQRTEPRTGEGPGEWWPFAIDDVLIRRADLEGVLGPHVGRRIRIVGLVWDVLDDERKVFQVTVDPEKIVALAGETRAKAKEAEAAP